MVRYDRAGKWYVEGPALKLKLTLHGAASLALWLEQRGGHINSGLDGGGAFDRRVASIRAERIRTTS